MLNTKENKTSKWDHDIKISHKKKNLRAAVYTCRHNGPITKFLSSHKCKVIITIHILRNIASQKR